MTENPQIELNGVAQFPCANCGAELFFNAENQMLSCGYCGSSQIIAAGTEIEKLAYTDFLSPSAELLQPMAKSAMQLTCGSCGATVVFTPPEISRDCDFCGSKIVAQSRAADPLIAPRGVLPFSITSKQVAKALQAWLSSLWFAPNALKEIARAEKIRSVYIPYWSFDSFTSSYYEGERGEHYWETETYFDSGERKTRQVMKTRWHSVHGTISRQFLDCLIPATKSLPRKYLEKLEPWEIMAAKSYDPAFLAGHKAQTYQIVLPEGFERFKEMASAVVREDARQDIGGDEQRVHDCSTEYSNTMFEHLLLPVYSGAYRFNGKTFQIVVNGRTGEVHGDRPYSIFKIALLSIALIILLLIVLMVVAK